MWSPDRRLVLAALLALAGCGFTPAFAPGGGAAGLLNQVRPDDPVDADGFAFNRRIGERLGPAADGARFRLATAISVKTAAQGITSTQAITRYALNGSADYTLTDAASGAVLARGNVASFSSHSATGTTIATLAAERDARDRLMVMLADQVVTRLIAVAPAP
ncbi:LPS assembly lipoprotein LptE [Paracoccus sp. p4-l81]|uniref:LPS assembly lipoprotein LptE n=1 Tax=unclassified Paracoccus (in: a-proteobacteria) TaxID=2688777 RepID=UPI0035B7545D